MKNITYPLPYNKEDDVDYRAKRITAYLDLLNDLIENQISEMKSEPFTLESDNTKYFKLLPDTHPMKAVFQQMEQSSGKEKEQLETQCRNFIRPGAIDVNIMTKLDRTNRDINNQELPDKY